MATAKKALPPQSSIDALLALITTAEAAEYLHERAKTLMDPEVYGPEAQVFLDSLDPFINLIYQQDKDTSNPWSGQGDVDQSRFERGYKNQAEDVITGIKKSYDNPSLNMSFAINNDASILRGFQLNGQNITSEDINDILDKLFHAWLFEHQMLTHNGKIYLADANGNLKTEHNTPIVADPEKFKQLIHDTDSGFVQYLNKNGLEGHLHEEPFPSQVEEAQPEAKTPTEQKSKDKSHNDELHQTATPEDNQAPSSNMESPNN